VRYDDLPLETRGGGTSEWSLSAIPIRLTITKLSSAISGYHQSKTAGIEVGEVNSYAEAMIETVREPLLVLDEHLKVLAASRSFYDTFKVTLVRLWESISTTLETDSGTSPGSEIASDILKNTRLDNYAVDHVFPTIGHKFMVLNAVGSTRKTSAQE